ncbi:hypothetical protein GCM10028791_13380 [Echinicola sediminis]
MRKGFNVLFLLFSLSLLGSCDKGKKNGEDRISLNDIKDLKTRQYAVEGQTLYENYCANCHQKNGTGLGQLIPPLKNADYMSEDVGRTVNIIKNGLKGEITVNGIGYNQPMPGNPHLSNLEIAEIATYIFSVFGNSEKLIDANAVKKYLEE